MTTPAFATDSGVASREETAFSDPARDSAPAGLIPRGATLVLHERKGGWYRFTSGEIQGWIPLASVTVKRADSDTDQKLDRELQALGKKAPKKRSKATLGSQNLVLSTGVRGLTRMPKPPKPARRVSSEQ